MKLSISAKLDLKSQVALWVEGEGQRSLAENAFIETLQKRSYASVLSTGKTSGTDASCISTWYMKSKSEQWVKNILNGVLLPRSKYKTILGVERKVYLLGTFQREGKDKAQIFPSVQMPVLQADEEESLIQRLLTPLIILSGAVLIIFLLFTVRS